MNLQSARAVAIALASLAALSACIDDDLPEVARVIVEANPTDSVVLVVSTNFVVSFNEETETREAIPLTADTTLITGDFDQEYSIRSFRRIYAHLRNDGETPELVRMQILIDGSENYNTSRQISGGEFLQFMFTSRISG